MALPTKEQYNEKFLPKLPYLFYTFPLELLILDDEFVLGGALDDINDTRKPDWRDAPSKLSYRGTFTMMGQMGVGTQWGIREHKSVNLWKYLSDKYNLKENDYYMISNALPTFTQTENILTFARAAYEARQARLAAERENV